MRAASPARRARGAPVTPESQPHTPNLKPQPSNPTPPISALDQGNAGAADVGNFSVSAASSGCFPTPVAVLSLKIIVVVFFCGLPRARAHTHTTVYTRTYAHVQTCIPSRCTSPLNPESTGRRRQSPCERQRCREISAQPSSLTPKPETQAVVGSSLRSDKGLWSQSAPAPSCLGGGRGRRRRRRRRRATSQLAHTSKGVR